MPCPLQGRFFCWRQTGLAETPRSGGRFIVHPFKTLSSVGTAVFSVRPFAKTVFQTGLYIFPQILRANRSPRLSFFFVWRYYNLCASISKYTSSIQVRNISRHPIRLFSLAFFPRCFLTCYPPVPLVCAASILFLGPLSRLVACCRLAFSSSSCQEVINLSAPWSTPECHDTPRFTLTASVHTNFGTPKTHGSFRSSFMHINHFCSGHPRPGTSPPTSSPNMSRFGSSQSSYLTTAPNSQCCYRTVASTLLELTFFSAWAYDICRWVPRLRRYPITRRSNRWCHPQQLVVGATRGPRHATVQQRLHRFRLE